MKRLFCILFCLSLLACSSNKTETPKDLIPQEKMVQILADIHIAEALIETKVIYPDTALMTFGNQEKLIFKKHHVTEQEFRKTYKYYQQHLQQMDEMYEIIVDTLSLRETKARAGAGELQKLEKAQ